MGMDWLTRMNHALDLMEKRMEGRLDLEEIARAAYVSSYHFQRMFHMLTGNTVAEYMRKRKLTLAAQELATASAKVIDVALKYGYDSPESFAKAFRKIHGVTPTEARNPGVCLKAFPRISFHLSLRGDKDMEYRIVEHEALTVIGKSIQMSYQDGEQSRQIPLFWQACHQDGTVAKLSALGSDQNLLGIVMDTQPSREEMTYMIASRSNLTDEPEGLSLRTIAASTWVIFTAIGPVPGSIQNIFCRVFQEWFPATGYEIAEGPVLEVYPPGDLSAEEYRCEAWIPIAKK